MHYEASRSLSPLRRFAPGHLPHDTPSRPGLQPRGFRFGSLIAAALCAVAPLAHAAPWADVGDSQLRSDIEQLAAAGVIENVTTQWPIPWGRLLDRLTPDNPVLSGAPMYVQEAAERVRLQAGSQMMPDTVGASISIDGTNSPELVRGFDALGLSNEQGQASLSWNGEATAVRISAGAQSHNRFDHETLLLDGSFIAHQFGNTALYIGEITHWWGPGWISALSESNNAHPIPQLGITRINPEPFHTRWLSWLGPWQAEFFVGWLNGPRSARNTLLDGLHMSINPLPGLELGVARLDELCGAGHPCNPAKSYFDLSNSNSHPSTTNDEGNIDIKYDGTLGTLAYSVYLQFMNEDTNPFLHSGTSHLAGFTTWQPVGDTRVRITAEWADSVATTNIFSFGDYIYTFAYNDYKYVDGMRYFGRAFGFSLDDDSRLDTLQLSWTGAYSITWTLTYDHADVSNMHDGFLSASIANPLTTAPVAINLGEVRAGIPLGRFTIDAALRYQDDQPRPDHGHLTSGELRVRYDL